MGDHEPFRLSVDRAKCEGHGMCEQVAPGLIRLNDDAEPLFDLDDIESAHRPLAEAAVQACPVAALTVHSTPTSVTQRAQELHEPPGLRNGAPLSHG
jgi:ferredoxin